MELRSDLVFQGDYWEIAEEKLHHKFFESQWGIFKVCLTIGILYDKQLDDEKFDSDRPGDMNIPRNMFNRHSKDMVVCFQAAILTTSCVDLSEKDRLYLAFSEDISDEDLEDDDVKQLKEGITELALEFDKIGFLKRFANFGVTKLVECISDNDIETMENISVFLNDSVNGEVEDLQKLRPILQIDDLDENDF